MAFHPYLSIPGMEQKAWWLAGALNKEMLKGINNSINECLGEE